jgi:hypothetical protein
VKSGDAKEDDEEDEEVIVRGYAGNAAKTEKGIKSLGERLSRYVLSMTYPDQPFLPTGKGANEGLAEAMNCHLSHHHHHHHSGHHDAKSLQKNSVRHSDAADPKHDCHCRPYKITSISFVGHSLGGLVQTYAIAYIQTFSPDFFDLIRPINFIALASPFLGLSNENPLYVKFALDFGLVGRTGQDLGLTWRAQTIARNGWGIVSNRSESAHKKVHGQSQPESKPLLRILPTGPAHTALGKFRNRTVYSNVVNDGIVPLRTSCLLFLDWQGLGRVEKARRDAGLVETVVGFGWAELTGTNILSPRSKQQKAPLEDYTPQSDSGTSTPKESMRQVPQPSDDAMHEDDRASIRSVPRPLHGDDDTGLGIEAGDQASYQSPFAGFFNLFRSSQPPKPYVPSAKQKKILRRGQTIASNSSDTPNSSTTDISDRAPGKATTGHEMEEAIQGMTAPPKTTFLEAAGDLLNPTMPTTEYLLDPSKRPRTIFHDRVYHPSDIPPPPMKSRQSTLIRRKTSSKLSASSQQSIQSSPSPHPSINHADSMESAKYSDDTVYSPDEMVDGSSMRVEEKIARDYHRDLSWRKVLVKLEPDAHNNIIVRRMFANAHGWPVVKHLVDAHFSDSKAARTRDDEEPNAQRAFASHLPPDADGREVKRLDQLKEVDDGSSTSSSEPAKGGEANGLRDASDEVPERLKNPNGHISPASPPGTASSDGAGTMDSGKRSSLKSEAENVDIHKQPQMPAQPTKEDTQQEHHPSST